MKKTISIIAASAMICAAASPVFAANTETGNPDVFINGTKVFFDDQEAVIVEGRTLVPARGVFEAMGAKVSWDEELKQVQVESADNNTWVQLVIDDENMRIYDMSGLFMALVSGQDFHAPETVVELDVAPQILSDRTMIPLRAIGEAVGADVKWDEEAYAVKITSKDAPANEKTDGKPAFSLSASADTVAEGETVDLFVNVENLPADTYASAVTVTVEYNKENFEFAEVTLMNGDTVLEGALIDYNTDFSDDCVKIASVTINEETAAKTDGTVMKITFKSLNGGEGTFALSDGYQTKIGYNTSLFAAALNENAHDETYLGSTFYVDTTPITVNAAE